jgi:hypothetical protein
VLVIVAKMPLDSRRLQGPENATAYSLYIPDNKSYHDLLGEIVTSDKKRKDGRKLNDQRRICKKHNLEYIPVTICTSN